MKEELGYNKIYTLYTEEEEKIKYEPQPGGPDYYTNVKRTKTKRMRA